MTSSIGPLGGVGPVGGAVTGVTGLSAITNPITTQPLESAVATQNVETSPSVIVSIGAEPVALNLMGTRGIDTYRVVNALGETVSRVSGVINVGSLSSRTGLSVDFINGFIAGMGVGSDGRDVLTEAIILALLLRYLDRE